MIKKLFIAVFHLVCRIIYKVSGFFVKKDRIYFESFHGKQFSDSPRSIYTYMKEHYPEYELVWGVKKGYELLFMENDVEYVQRLSLKGMFMMASSKVWVINTRMPDWMIKSKKTIYIQTWHGTPLKKLGLDIEKVEMPGVSTQDYREKFSKESARWDYLISANSYSSQIFKRAFNFKNTMLEVGYPRNDDLVNIFNVNHLKENLGISNEKKIILYAPTWRDNQFYTKGSYKFELPFSISDFTNKFGDKTILLVRMHYLISEWFDLSQYEGKVLDVSNYPDMRELLMISDLLITDYSSSFFDFSLTNKPVLFYMFDQDEYSSVTRGMYFNASEVLPWPIVKKESDLTTKVMEYLDGEIEVDENKLTQFKRRFADFDHGTACESVVKIIIEKTK